MATRRGSGVLALALALCLGLCGAQSVSTVYEHPTDPGYIQTIEAKIAARPNIDFVFPTGGPVQGGTNIAIFGQRISNITQCRLVPVDLSINSDFYSPIDHAEIVEHTYGLNVADWDGVVGDSLTTVPTNLSEVFVYADLVEGDATQKRQCMTPDRTYEGRVFFRNFTTGLYRVEVTNDEEFWWANSSVNYDTYVYTNILFTFYQEPTITGVWPRGGPNEGGTQMRIKGTGFSNFHDSVFTVIRTGDTYTTPDSVSYTELNCTVPPSAHNSADTLIEVALNSQNYVDGNTTFGANANANATATTIPTSFKFYPSPTISAVYPEVGSVLGGTTVTVSGTGFDGMTAGITPELLGLDEDVYGNALSASRDLLRLQLTPVGTTLRDSVMPHDKCAGNGSCAGYGQLLWVHTITSASQLLFVTDATLDEGLHNVSITLNGQDFHQFPPLQFRTHPEPEPGAASLLVYPFGGKSVWDADGGERPTLLTITPVNHELPSSDVVDRSLTYCSFTDDATGAKYNTPLLSYASDVVTCYPPAIKTSAADAFNDCDAIASGSGAAAMSALYTCERLPHDSVFPRTFTVRLRLNGQDERVAVGSYVLYDMADALTLSPAGGSIDGGTVVAVSHAAFAAQASDPLHPEDVVCTFGTKAVVARSHDSVNGVVTCVAPPASRRAMQQVVNVTVTINGQDYTTAEVWYTYYLAYVTGFSPPLGALEVVETLGVASDAAVVVGVGGAGQDLVVPSPVTVYGRGFDGFDDSLAQSFCYFGDGIKVNVTSKTSTRVVCDAFVPPAARRYEVTVTLNDQDRMGGVDQATRQPLAFGVFNHSITALSPTRCSLEGGCVISVAATHFDEALGFNDALRLVVCLFNGTEAPAVAVTATHVACTAPTPEVAEPAYSAVRVRVNGRDAVGTLWLEYFQEPSAQITGIVPTSGPVSGGTLVDLAGVWTIPADTSLVRCRFGFQEAEVAFVGPTRITCRSPWHSAATVDVTLSMNGQDFSDSVALYTYFKDPSIASISPHRGPHDARTTLNITGLNLEVGVDDEMFCRFGRFGSTRARHDLHDPSKVVCDTPLVSEADVDPNTRLEPGDTETVEVLVTLNNQNFFGEMSGDPAVEFTFYAASVLSVFPPAAPSNGGHWVRVEGKELDVAGPVDEMRCQFGCFDDAAGAWTSQDNTTHCVGVTGFAGVDVYQRSSVQLYCDTPATTAHANLTFHLRLNAIDPYMGDVSPSDVRFAFYDQPTVTGISPPGGPAAGGNEVVLSGSGFDAWGGAYESLCNFGNRQAGKVPAVEVAADGSWLKCVAPPATRASDTAYNTGEVEVWLAMNGVHFLNTTMKYTYYSAVVDAVFPLSAPLVDEAFSVVVAGSDFRTLWAQTDLSLVRCEFGEVATTTATYKSVGYDEIQCPTPAGLATAGTAPQSVVLRLTLNGQVFQPLTLFTFYSPPNVTAMHPQGGPVGGGTPVHLQGHSIAALRSLLPNLGFPEGHALSFAVTSPNLVGTPKDALPYRALLVDRHHRKALDACRGGSYTFDVDNTAHPVYISASSVGGLEDTQAVQTDGMFVFKGQVVFSPTHLTPPTVYYQSRLYRHMGNSIAVANACNTTLQVLFDNSVPNQFAFVDNPTVETWGLATVVHFDATNAYVVTPEAREGTGLVNVSLTLNGKDFYSAEASAPQLAGAPTGFAFYQNPNVTGLSPPGGPYSGGTVVTVLGDGLHAFGGVGVSRCLFGDPPQHLHERWVEDLAYSVYVQRVGVNGTEVDCSSPIFPEPTTVTVHVALNAFDYVTGGDAALPTALSFRLYAPPSVFLVSPRGGPTGGGTTVSLFGEGFTALDEPSLVQCRFGELPPVAALSVSDSVVVCEAPNATAALLGAGWVNLTVSLNAQDFHAAGRFRYYDDPALVGLTRVSSAPADTSVLVEIEGSGFDEGPGWDAVMCLWDGTDPVPIHAVGNATHIACLTPPTSPVSTALRVSLNAGQQFTTASLAFEFFAEPELSAAVPWSAGVAHETDVVVSGAQLQQSSDTALCVFVSKEVPGLNFTTPVDAFAVDLSSATCKTPNVEAEALVHGGTPEGLHQFALHVAINGHDLSDGAVDIGLYWAVLAGAAGPDSVSDVVPRGAPTTATTEVGVWSDGLTALFDAYYERTLEGRVDAANDTAAVLRAAFGDMKCVFSPDDASWTVATDVTGVSRAFREGSALGWQFVLACTSPTGAAAGEVGLRVALNGNDASDFGHRFVAYDPPTLGAVSPAGGLVNGLTRVNVSGEGLDSLAHVYQDAWCRFGVGDVRLDAAPASVVGGGANATTVVQCTSPPASVAGVAGAGGVGSVDVLVSLNGVDFDSVGSVQFAYYTHALTASSSPASGPVAGGSATLVFGSNLNSFGVDGDGANTGSVKCRFGDREVEATNITANSLTCATPAQDAAGAVALSVTLNDQQYVSLSGQGQVDNGGQATALGAQRFVEYSFYAAPRWASVVPLGGHKAGGTRVVVAGQGFVPFGLSLPTRCRFGDDVVTASSVSDTEVVCFTPQKPDAAGTYRVEVALNGQDYQASATYDYSYYDAPNITAVAPVVGSALGGTAVNVTGRGFLGFANGTAFCVFGDAVDMDGVVRDPNAVATVLADDLLSCVAPNGQGQGLVEVRVSLNDGVDIVSGGLQFLYSCSHLANSRTDCVMDETCGYCDESDYTEPLANQGVCQTCAGFGALVGDNWSGCQNGPLVVDASALGSLASNADLSSHLPMTACNRLTYTHTVDPGCCGAAVNHTVRPNLFVYLRVVPRHTHYQLRVWVKNEEGDTTRLYAKRNGLPSSSDYDKASARTTPPHRLTIDQHELTCAQGQAPNCDPWFVAVGGSPVDVRRDNRFDIELTADDHNEAISFDVFVSLEFNYTHFGFHECEGSSGLPLCGLALNGASRLVETPRGAKVLRLSTTQPHEASSAWYDTQLFLRDGFDTAFTFQISSPTLCVAPFEFFDSERTGDIRKTNYNVDAYTGLSSFDTSPEQFLVDGSLNVTADMFEVSPVHRTNLPYASTTLGDDVCGEEGVGWGGEGFAFVIQSSAEGTGALGCPDSGVGFASDQGRDCEDKIQNSLAIEFDSYFNVTKFELRTRNDHPNVSIAYSYSVLNSISVFSHGVNDHDDPHTSRQVHPLREAKLFDGKIHDVLVRYLPPVDGNSGYIFVYLDGVESKQPIISLGNIDLESWGVLNADGKAHIGFTAATGIAAQNQDILTWSFCQLPGCATY